MLRCPQCGAGVAPGSSRCEFCAAQLLVRACPRCFAQVFHGSKHCNHCGTPIDVPARVDPDGNAARRRCPRCDQVTLDARLVADVLLDECPQCHGVWLDSVAVERIVKERRQATASAVMGIASPTAAVADAFVEGKRLYVKCPDCEQVMNRVNFGRRSGIIIDVCRAHGTWFDADELPGVVTFVMSGGLEESARREIEDAREEARRARAHAEGERVGASLGLGPYGHGADSLERALTVTLFGGLLGSVGRLLRR
jgi:Zn-finger nucleic acid-binding protein